MTSDELRRIIPRNEKYEIIGARMKQLDRILVSYTMSGRELELMDMEIRLFKKKLQELEAKRMAREKARVERNRYPSRPAGADLFETTLSVQKR